MGNIALKVGYVDRKEAEAHAGKHGRFSAIRREVLDKLENAPTNKLPVIYVGDDMQIKDVRGLCMSIYTVIKRRSLPYGVAYDRNEKRIYIVERSVK